ncbi:tetratricopeptide repeat protein [Halpernia frigidisoli]|uniref:Tetratricopeptide repeat-containing protein n=1 Tax=Halpernia frigidisoli TaxID=1125876 RepID=A0A1I3I0K0_9FLAO|nr:tetratricopeptide repeat protein [Halpernia frigidisoli]SFI41380.1 Tetratricopeptide repeat-containing protein [Halpernia frigidisoli]
MFKYIIVLFIISFSSWSCNKKPIVDNKEHSAVLKYLSSKDNYQNKKEYVLFFEKNYKNYIEKKEYRNAEETLIKYGETIIDQDALDSFIYAKTLQFIKMKYPVKKDTLYANLYLLNGLQLQYNYNLDSALIYAKKAIEFSKYSPDSDVYTDSQNLLGTTYTYTGEYKKAVPIFIELIRKAEQDNNHRRLGSLYNNLASCYLSFYAYKEAEKFYVKACDEFLLRKDTANYLAIRANYILNNFETEHDTLKTLNLIVPTDQIFKKYKNPSEMTQAYVNDIYTFKYILKKNYDSAKFFNELGIDYFKKIDNKQILENYKTTGERIFFYKYGYLQNSKRTKELADISIENDDHQIAATMYNLLYQDALKNKNYQNAIKFRDLEIKYLEIVQKQNADGKLFEFDKKYQSEKREKQIAAQKSEIQTNYFNIIALLLFLAVLILSVWLYLNKLKRRKIIEEKNKNEQFTFDLLENVEVE